ncbi:pre-rRNA processing protein FTSJ3 [Agrilus planipennis]|uniref:Pre-rRNA processing protein FTSJ3 n=1 Tax=Agrilus planipennis TaxID=224129 RepID=A0A7F5RCK6_AGRPL|nr:pre-rRNA processing protein FTSJ3 [Agrilus planipennis]
MQEKFILDDTSISNHEKTTNEIKECCKDIKVLGRKDLRKLLAWWKILHEELAVPAKVEEVEENSIKENNEKENQEDEFEEIAKEITELQEEERKELKRKRKKTMKERKKLNERLNLKMVLKGDSGPQMEDDDMFRLKQISDKTEMKKVLDDDPDLVADSDDDKIKSPKRKFERYEKGEGHLDNSGLYYKDSDSELEMETDEEEEVDGVKEGLGLGSDSDSDELEGEIDNKPKRNKKVKEHPLITDLDYRDKEEKRVHKANLFFERDAFKDLIGENEEDADLDRLIKVYKEKGSVVLGEDDGTSNKEVKSKKIKGEKQAQENKKIIHDDDSDSESSSDSDSDYEVLKEISKKNKKKESETSEKDGFDIVKEKGKLGKRKLTEEELALGTMMINSRKTKRDIVDAAWNRYSFNDVGLPDWFVDDESKHMRKETLVPKELVDEYSSKLQDLNVRPIKKVIEAKARKKKRVIKKLERAKKKIEAIMENVDVSDKEKAKQINQLYKKAKAGQKKEVTYVVSKKATASKRPRKPAGVKGPYKMVDPRMKKDTRAQQRTVKKGKNKIKKPKNPKKKKTKQ